MVIIVIVRYCGRLRRSNNTSIQPASLNTQFSDSRNILLWIVLSTEFRTNKSENTVVEKRSAGTQMLLLNIRPKKSGEISKLWQDPSRRFERISNFLYPFFNIYENGWFYFYLYEQFHFCSARNADICGLMLRQWKGKGSNKLVFV